MELRVATTLLLALIGIAARGAPPFSQDTVSKQVRCLSERKIGDSHETKAFCKLRWTSGKLLYRIALSPSHELREAMGDGLQSSLVIKFVDRDGFKVGQESVPFTAFLKNNDEKGKTLDFNFDGSLSVTEGEAKSIVEWNCEWRRARSTAPAKPEPHKLGQKTLLGRLGQVRRSTKIYTRPEKDSGVYYTLRANEYIVFFPYDGHWLKVLLQDGTYGFAQLDAVAKMPYDIVEDKLSGSHVAKD